MTWPVPGRTDVSATFEQMRPLSVPKEERTHIHGAIDIPAPSGTEIIAPEDGVVVCFAAMRRSRNLGGGEMPDMDLAGFDIRGHHYYYDIYGGVIVLVGDSGRVHVITHSWRNQLFNRWAHSRGASIETVETPEVERFPAVCGEVSSPVSVGEGEKVGYMRRWATSETRAFQPAHMRTGKSTRSSGGQRTQTVLIRSKSFDCPRPGGGHE